MAKIPIDGDSELDKMAARSPGDVSDSRKSKRALVAERLDKIEAARANGWTLDQIAEALNIKDGHILSAYISSIKIAEKKKTAPPPVVAPVVPTAAPEPPKFIPGQLPPIPGYEAPKPTMSPELAELARRAEERSAERRAAKAAQQAQPKGE